MKKVVFYAVAISAIMIGTAYAVPPTNTNRSLQALIGGTLNVTNSITAVDGGFLVQPTAIAAAGTSSGAPVQFSAFSVASSGVTAGDWVLEIQLLTTANTPASTTFTVSTRLQFSNDIGFIPFPLYIATGSTVPIGNEVLVFIDVSSSMNSLPFSYTIIVQ